MRTHTYTHLHFDATGSNVYNDMYIQQCAHSLRVYIYILYIYRCACVCINVGDGLYYIVLVLPSFAMVRRPPCICLLQPGKLWGQNWPEILKLSEILKQICNKDQARVIAYHRIHSLLGSDIMSMWSLYAWTEGQLGGLSALLRSGLCAQLNPTQAVSVYWLCNMI